MLPQLTGLKGAALDFLFPRFCVGCGKEGSLLCNSCKDSLSRIEPPICLKCGRPQTGSVSICSSCVNLQADIEGIRSPFQFEGVMRKAVHEFKYNNLHAIAGGLAGLLSDYLNRNPIIFDVLVPVPLHTKRLKERGYNQSALLAKELGRLTGKTVDEKTMIRNRYNLPQAKTSNVEQRRQNVTGVFVCQNDAWKDKIVLLIDDVSTSGATLNACATALKTIGTKEVWGLTLAREI